MSKVEKKIRVLVVDDSFFIRKYLRQLIDGQEDMQVVGEASDGIEAVNHARKLLPDVVTMDFHLPKKNGLQATAEIMLSVTPQPRVLLVSAFSGTDGHQVFESLNTGAVDFVEKPSGEVSLDMERVGNQIVEKIRALGKVIPVASGLNNASNHVSKLHAGLHIPSVSNARVLVIGASTGGPPLIEEILRNLPTNIGLSVLVVQHMSSYFTNLFADRLDHIGAYRVKEGTKGDILAPDHVYIAPGDSFVSVGRVGAEGYVLELTKKTEFAERRESDIDFAMNTVAETVGQRAIGIILSGMGNDGAIGLSAIAHCGGICMIQDPSEATISSMPTAARALDPTATIVRVSEIVPNILSILQGELLT